MVAPDISSPDKGKEPEMGARRLRVACSGWILAEIGAARTQSFISGTYSQPTSNSNVSQLQPNLEKKGW